MRFEIFINGERKCFAGIDGYGVLSTTLTRVKRNPVLQDLSKLTQSTPEEFLKEKVEVEVGGLDSNKNERDLAEHFHYFRKRLKAGDELLIRVLPPGEFDEPKNQPETDDT